jgi:hypothetical protein
LNAPPHSKRICLCCLFEPEDRRLFVEFVERRPEPELDELPPPPPPPTMELQ